MTIPEPSPTQERRYYFSLVGVAVLLCWVLPGWSSLWLDETHTYWIVKDGIFDVITRAIWSGQSPLYFLFAWLAVRTGGNSEIVMRIPSMIAMGISAVFLYHIGKRLFDAETGLLASVVFVSLKDVLFAAADARPYALTMMLLLGHVLLLLRWLETGRWRDAAGCALLGALTAYGHVVLAVGLAVPALYAFWRTQRRGRLLLIWLATAVLMAPLSVQILTVSGHKTGLSDPYLPDMQGLFEYISPPPLVTCIGAGVLVAFLVLPSLKAHWRPTKSSTVLMVAWMLFPLFLFFILGRVTTIRLFIPRYLLPYTPGIALLVGCLVRAFDPARARMFVAAAIVIMSVCALGRYGFRHSGDDWRGTMAAVRAAASGTEIPVLISSAFLGAQTPEDISNSKLKEAFFTPEIMYPAAGRIVHLPFVLDENYLDSVIETELAGKHEFLFVGPRAWVTWFKVRLRQRRPVVEHLGPYGSMDPVRIRLQ